MNKAEYNRKMKALGRDIDRHIADIDKINEKLSEAYTKRRLLSCEGWEE